MTVFKRIAVAGVLLYATASLSVTAVHAQDKRIGLKTGWMDAASAASGMELVANIGRAPGFFDEKSLGNILLANSDMAFRGNTLFLGNFTGFQIYDVSNAWAPKLRSAVMCPGGQGDMSVYGNLLFMSVEMPNGRIDCGNGNMVVPSSKDRFLGVRVFDISDLSNPKQVAAVQTCRGSHTHTLVTDPKDNANVYLYVSGASGVRPESELAGCSGGMPDKDPNTALFRIEVIRVPIARPQDAAIVATPRIFADAQTGAVAGLWQGGAHGAGTQNTSRTDQCHDITAFPDIGLAAGACSGNGILLDISNPANPVRIAEVVDPNFAYWHSATFNNDGSKVIFTDEWGGGMAAKCTSADPKLWGADAIFSLDNRKLTPAGYYKLPAPQSAQENCVAHNGSLVPVPGRDIMVQAWYQGGISMFDFTDPANVKEIGYFDRGALSPTSLMLGGFWSAYYYNGFIYGSEITRGLDIFKLVPGENLTQNEIDAAKTVRFDEWNPQRQQKVTWMPSLPVAKAYMDQLARNPRLKKDVTEIMHDLDHAEKEKDAAKRGNLLRGVAVQVEELLPASDTSADGKRVQLLQRTLKELAAAR